MSATLVSSNTTIKINAAVSATNSSTSATITLYTAPANGYAVIQLHDTVGGVGNFFTIGGRTVVIGTTAVSGFYVGPSQAVVINRPGAVNSAASISGVEFVNTP